MLNPPMRYSSTLNMRPAQIGANVIERTVESLWVPRPFPHAPVWARLGQPFDREHFLSAHPPVQVGRLAGGVSPADGPRAYLRVPIKVAERRMIQIPTELIPILRLIEHALETFAAWYPAWDTRHVHVTWEAGWVEAGSTQWVPGWHVDGFQGVRQAPHATEASLLWSDALPTEYCVQPFMLTHLDTSRHNAQEAIAEQAKEANAFPGQPLGLYLIDPYCVHRAAVATERTWRNFVRVTVADIALEDPGNTLNLGLTGGQEPRPRLEVRDRLFVCPGSPSWDTLGFEPIR